MGLLSTTLQQLTSGTCNFEFRERNGKIRRAKGTLNLKLIPKEDWPKSKLNGQLSPKVDEYSVRAKMYQPYYDLDLQMWRRFKALSLIRLRGK